MMAQQTLHPAQRAPTLPARRSTCHAAIVPVTDGQQRRVGGAARDVHTRVALLPQMISTAALLAGAWYLSQEAVPEQDRFEASDRRPCPSCGGSGLQPCFCTKWSDGDTGCSSCSHSGWTKCKSCGGGGMAVPIKVTIRKDNML